MGNELLFVTIVDVGALKSIFSSITCSNRVEWERILPTVVEVIVVKNVCCYEEPIESLDLSGYVKLRDLAIGDYCFDMVKELKLIRMNELESVVIGEYSFVKHPYDLENDGRDDKRHFYLKNCPKLRELKVGPWSFADYSVCEIENVNALEVIEMGELRKRSPNFFWASLELKSILIHSE